MSDVAKIENLAEYIIEIKGQKVLLDAEIFDEDLQTSDTGTSIELNFAVLKFKDTVKKKK
jgi:hypothetical protein